MRMGVVLGRLAVGGPAGVADAGMAGERLTLSRTSRLFSFPSARRRVSARLPASQYRRIIAAIFKALQRIHDFTSDLTATKHADNSTHAVLISPNRRKTAITASAPLNEDSAERRYSIIIAD